MIHLYKLKQDWTHYTFQCFLAVLSIGIIVFVLGVEKVVIISSLAATAFICFMTPKSHFAQTLRVLGAYIVALICGAVFQFIHLPAIAEYPAVVGIVMFLMVVLDFEHPPAAGVAIAVTINEVDYVAVAAIMLSIIVITQLRYYLRHWLKDLV
ncbi:MAG TPA: HPP family protein [Phycisphaerales bacterium]|nr:HPP family protein [Phycisphaerales bacterium]